MERSQILPDLLNQKELEKLCPVYPPLTLPNIRAAIAYRLLFLECLLKGLDGINVIHHIDAT